MNFKNFASNYKYHFYKFAFSEHINKLALRAYQYSDALKITGKGRNTSQFFKMLEKGMLKFINSEGRYRHYIPSSSHMKIATQFDQMVTVLNEHYGENWDFHYEPVGDEFKFQLILVIHYPEVELTNGTKNHTIRDLFVTSLISLSDSLEIVAKPPHGFRTTLSYVEWYQGYAHSHIYRRGVQNTSPQDFFNTSKFCLGSDTDLENITSVVFNETDYVFDTNIFEGFLYTLDDAVAWESIDGGPFFRISSLESLIGTKNIETTSKILADEREIKNSIEGVAISFLSREGTEELIKPRYDEDGIAVRVDEDFKEAVKDFISHKISSNSLNSFSYPRLLVANRSDTPYLSDDNYYILYDSKFEPIPLEVFYETLKEENTKGHIQGPPYFQFRNTKKFIHVDPLPDDMENTTANYFVHPEFIKLLVNTINKKIKENATKKSIIDTNNQVRNS